MSLSIPPKLELDTEVEAFVRRVGNEQHPLNSVKGYNIDRVPGKPTVITVTFIADDEFSKSERG